MNWRFLPPLDPQVSLFLCRDLDSRITAREVAAVEEWLQSGREIHSMRDHPAHTTPLLGAAWGARITEDNIRHKVALHHRTDTMFFLGAFVCSVLTTPNAIPADISD